MNIHLGHIHQRHGHRVHGPNRPSLRQMWAKSAVYFWALIGLYPNRKSMMVLCNPFCILIRSLYQEPSKGVGILFSLVYFHPVNKWLLVSVGRGLGESNDYITVHSRHTIVRSFFMGMEPLL